jgi:hypothetical protein
MKKLYAILSSALFFSFSVKLNGQCTSSVPYYEGFQGITSNNQLPPCWVASNPSVSCLTSTLHQASFYYNPPGANYFYTNGLQLYSGIIYSVSLFYKTDNSGSQNWTDLSILLNNSQSATGATTIASTNGPAATSSYMLLSGTFSINVSGVYYLAIRGTGNTSGTSQYLYWDDLSVTFPCMGLGAPNSPTINLSASSASLCAGDSLSLTASGADTYTWNINSNNPSIIDVPMVTTNYMVVGTNTLTGCTSSVNQIIIVKPNPTIFILPNTPIVCAGAPATLTVIGNGNLFYLWSTGSSNSSIMVNPTISTVYTVVGTDADKCDGKASFTISVSDCTDIRTPDVDAPTQIMPNPSNGIFKIETNGSVMNVKLFGLDGREISSYVIERKENWVDIKNLANGIYYAEIRSEEKTKVFKIVKQ